ncbi:MAG: 3'(2'),5'-bisphosphate nucleotidase CysQ [Betaproteobacteria bacterium]|nr:MAG: 3'(2'),5'-bisphosphate nucleotidase CysQ [Betaproteobacteria bacterium]TAG46297.1 MAG: 3'(2'),5'-bisphosphate nucleotidase CysQ [Betaproteobacteria bacterium]
MLTDVQLAKSLATLAGETLVALRNQQPTDNRIRSAKTLGDEGDSLANDFLIESLRRERPHDAILSEESVDDFARLGAARVWIIDPLDGTREYREGRDDWAVHVALVERGVVTAASVSLPAQSLVFASDDAMHPASATANAERAHRIVVSRSRPPEFTQRVASAIGARIDTVGSAGAKAMCVVRGEAAAYLHDGGMNEWDAAAPVGVALAYGLAVCDLQGQTITFNHRDVVLRDGLILCRPEFKAAILNAL